MKLANDNRIKRYKNRQVNYKLPVFIYKNLTKKCYSIKQNGLVVAHGTRFCIKNCHFLVNEKLRKKIVDTKQKVVHAYIHGWIVGSGYGKTAKGKLPVQITYNPFLYKKFTSINFIPKHEVDKVSFVICNEYGVYYCN